jgi:predicted Zn-dependent protease
MTWRVYGLRHPGWSFRKVRKKRHFEHGIFCILLSLAMGVGFHLSAAPALAVSIEEETIVGERFLESMRKQFSFVDDDFVDEYVDELGHYLVKGLDTHPFPFQFYVIVSNDLNAFAGPGGYVFVYTGLINSMDRADELAAVLGHEIGHVSARHLSNRVEQNKKIALGTLAGVLAGVLIGGNASAALMTGSMAAGIQQQLSYSREDERQADQLGFKYMTLAGFDPSGMVELLNALEKGHPQGTNAAPSYLLTHPGGPERISNIESMTVGYKPGAENREVARLRMLFPYIKVTLAAKYEDTDDAERLLKKLAQESPDSAIVNYGYGLLWKEKAEYAKALEYLQKASKRDPTFLPILRNLGEVYHLMGQDRQAISVLEEALKIDDQDKATLFLLAGSYESLEEYGKATVFYERLASMKPVKDEVYQNLGICYGREGKLAQAHYHFAIYFLKLGELRKAKFHFQKADELAANDPGLRRMIGEAKESLRSREKKSSEY